MNSFSTRLLIISLQTSALICSALLVFAILNYCNVPVKLETLAMNIIPAWIILCMRIMRGEFSPFKKWKPSQ